MDKMLSLLLGVIFRIPIPTHSQYSPRTPINSNNER